MSKKIAIGFSSVVLVLASFFVLKSKFTSPKSTPTPTPTPEQAAQLDGEKQPKVSLSFSADSHYVTVNIANLHADQLEYNLIYDATVKKSQIQTGVNAAAKISGQSTYSKQQLLGSESSGKFTYHTNIQNAVMEITLRDNSNRSVFTSSYPFSVTPGKSLDLSPSP